jgi:hypothetical protein
MEDVRVSIEGIDEVMKKLKKLDDRIKKKVLKSVARESLKPMVQSYKRNIKDADEVFKVYRNGKVYAEIIPGQLRRSVGIKFPKYLNSANAFGASVGPRRSGSFKDPEKGGWYAGFINFGWLQVGAGKDYSGQNRGFAQKAQSGAKNKVRVRFVRTFGQKVKVELRKLKFGQRVGLR